MIRGKRGKCLKLKNKGKPGNLLSPSSAVSNSKSSSMKEKGNKKTSKKPHFFEPVNGIIPYGGKQRFLSKPISSGYHIIILKLISNLMKKKEL